MAAVGDGVDDFLIGQPVGTMQYGGFAEFGLCDAKQVVPLPEVSPQARAPGHSAVLLSRSCFSVSAISPAAPFLCSFLVDAPAPIRFVPLVARMRRVWFVRSRNTDGGASGERADGVRGAGAGATDTDTTPRYLFCGHAPWT